MALVSVGMHPGKLQVVIYQFCQQSRVIYNGFLHIFYQPISSRYLWLLIWKIYLYLTFLTLNIKFNIIVTVLILVLLLQL